MLCLQPGTGIATWLCDHLDHHLPILLGRIGPFAHRTETSTTKHEKPVQTSHRRDGGTSRTGLCQVPGHLNKIEHHVERCHRGLRFSQGIWLVTCRSAFLLQHCAKRGPAVRRVALDCSSADPHCVRDLRLGHVGVIPQHQCLALAGGSSPGAVRFAAHSSKLMALSSPLGASGSGFGAYLSTIARCRSTDRDRFTTCARYGPSAAEVSPGAQGPHRRHREFHRRLERPMSPLRWTKTVEELLRHSRPGKRTRFTRH